MALFASFLTILAKIVMTSYHACPLSGISQLKTTGQGANDCGPRRPRCFHKTGNSFPALGKQQDENLQIADGLQLDGSARSNAGTPKKLNANNVATWTSAKEPCSRCLIVFLTRLASRAFLQFTGLARILLAASATCCTRGWSHNCSHR